jgi:hypothetical protein
MPLAFQTKVVQPMESSTVFVKGAVTAGITEHCITHRVARRHFLIEMPQPFKERYHLEQYRIPVFNSMDMCKYTRWIIIQKKQKLRIWEPVKVSFFRDILPGPYEEIIYACDDDNCPQYTTDTRE